MNGTLANMWTFIDDPEPHFYNIIRIDINL